jgi:2-polyprenyl-3-methyl-5-hydroxy-6-metoxy-1,4-benzoquinol methylase
MPQDFVARAIIKAIRAFPRYPALSILDLSCGRAEIIRDLRDDGCGVRGTHFRGDDYKLHGRRKPQWEDLPIDQEIDLLEPLPYKSDSFDVVILSEVAEHLPTYIRVVHEAGRVLRGGGYLVLSTPNISRLHSRLHFFFTGTHKLIRRRVGWDISPTELYAYHISPVDFPLLHTLLFQAGLRVRRLGFTRLKLKHSWLVLLFPLLWLFTRMETSRRVSKGLHERGEKDLLRWMMHPAMLASEQLLLIGQKVVAP